MTAGGDGSAIPPRRSTRDWPSLYGAHLFWTDLIVIVLVIAVYGLVVVDPLRARVSWPEGPPVPVPQWTLLVSVALIWLIALDVIDTRDRHIVGSGVTEYRRIINATVGVFAFLVTLAFFLRIEVPRSLLLFALPCGMLVLVVSRWGWRQWLRAQQRAGRYTYRAVVIGERDNVRHIVESIRRARGTGFDIVGVITHDGGADAIEGVPVIGRFDTAMAAMDAVDADTVVIAGADELRPQTLRRIGWGVADRDGNFVVAPALTDVAGPRIHARPVAGLPLVHVEYPRLEGWKRVAKRVFDVVGALALIVLFSPLMLGTAIAIKLESPGRIIFRQIRIGRGGRPFGLLKFRSMVAGADDQLASLLDLQGRGDRPFFKVVDDPRITRVGRFIRRHSIDELPQLFNVLSGRMSLVGPRPQREAEVALYHDGAHRRLLVKPGLSGLWQVSGRSSLSWEDALRLDLYYVENWSFTQDLQILLRTVRAVVAPGASTY
ncbi:MAG: sugar transferase [Microbacterium sp.]